MFFCFCFFVFVCFFVFFLFSFKFYFYLLFIYIENSPCRGSKVSREVEWVMFTIIAVFTPVVIVDLFLLFPQEKSGDSIFPPYMAELFLCSKCQDIFQNIFQNKKIKANLFPDSSTPPTLGARQLLEGQGTSLFLLLSGLLCNF